MTLKEIATPGKNLFLCPDQIDMGNAKLLTPQKKAKEKNKDLKGK